MFAGLMAKPFVDKVLSAFTKTDPTTKRTLHKSFMMRTEDIAYHMMITGKRPRGNWGDPRPGEKLKKDRSKK